MLRHMLMSMPLFRCHCLPLLKYFAAAMLPLDVCAAMLMSFFATLRYFFFVDAYAAAAAAITPCRFSMMLHAATRYAAADSHAMLRAPFRRCHCRRH